MVICGRCVWMEETNRANLAQCTQAFTRAHATASWENIITLRVRGHGYVNNSSWLVLHYCSIFYLFRIGKKTWGVCRVFPPPRMPQFLDIKHGLAVSRLSLDGTWKRAASGGDGGGRCSSPWRPLISKLLTPCLYVRTHWSVSLLNVKCITCHWRVPVLIFRGLIST